MEREGTKTIGLSYWTNVEQPRRLESIKNMDASSIGLDGVDYTQGWVQGVGTSIIQNGFP